MTSTPRPVYDLFNKEDGPDLLFMGPTDRCVCGCDVFHALVWFDEHTREIAGYFTEMKCAHCGALVRGMTADPSEMT